MLDWLRTHNENERAESGSQIFDAPETPAPLFALRALSSLLVGSRDEEDEEDENKENIPLGDTESPSIGRRMHDGNRVDGSGAFATNQPKALSSASKRTPPKPASRRMPSSPTKSILRTPGAITPRRHNTSVQFKDAKQLSTTRLAMMSPDGNGNRIQKDEPRRATKWDVDGEEKETQKPANRWTATEIVSSSTDGRKGGLQQDEGTSPSYSVEEMNSYISATEREMKKLLRYNRRMRDYAWHFEKENATLRRDLDGVRRENEELRRDRQTHAPCASIKRREGVKSAGIEDSGLFDLSPPSLANTRAKQAAAAPATTTVASRRENSPVRKPRTTIAHKSTNVSCQQPLHTRLEVPDRTTTSSKPTHSPPASPKAVAKSSQRKKSMPSTQSASKAQPPPASDASRSHHTSNAGLRLTSKAQLPPDRLAAAKARLKAKNEARRKAALGTCFSVDKAGEEGEDEGERAYGEDATKTRDTKTKKELGQQESNLNQDHDASSNMMGMSSFDWQQV